MKPQARYQEFRFAIGMKVPQARLKFKHNLAEFQLK
jgi:hypothetical protein